MARTTSFVLLVLLAFWTAVIGTADFFVFGATARQFLARNFKATTCRIVQSQVTKLQILHAGITIQYEYTNNGRVYRGSGYRYDDQYSAMNALDIVKSYPPYSLQTVYYNPKHPADAILSPGVDGADLMLLMFSAPINILIFLVWSWTLTRYRDKRVAPAAGGVRIRRQKGGIRIRFADISAFEAGLYAFGVATFAATFPVVVVNGFSPELDLMELVWSAVLAGATVAFGWKAMMNGSGKYDLLIDGQARTLTLPQTCGRHQPITFPWSEMAGVSMQKRVSRITSGSYHSYLPTLNLGQADAAPRRESLCEWGWSEEKARGFCQWLSGELGLAFKGIEDEQSGPEASLTV